MMKSIHHPVNNQKTSTQFLGMGHCSLEIISCYLGHLFLGVGSQRKLEYWPVLRKLAITFVVQSLYVKKVQA